MTKQINHENKNIDLEAIAKQWVDLVLAHIEAKKQRINTPGKKYKEGAN